MRKNKFEINLATCHWFGEAASHSDSQVFRALSEAVHVVPPCERLKTSLMPIKNNVKLFIVLIYGASYC